MKFLLCLICLITVSCNAVIDPQEDEPYDTFSEVYTSYLDCLEAGIIRALNII